MHYTFDIKFAIKIGVEEAIILENLIFWIKKNKANNKNLHDGIFWTYNSIKAFNELFPFWSPSQIKRILKSLVDQKVILVGEFNQNPYDRTSWFSLADDYYQLIDETKSATRRDEISKCTVDEISHSLDKTDINSFNKPDINNTNQGKINFDLNCFTEKEKQSVKEWLAYKKQIKDFYKTQRGADAFIISLKNFKDARHDICELIAHAIDKEWRGIYLYTMGKSKLSAQSARESIHACNLQKFDGEF